MSAEVLPPAFSQFGLTPQVLAALNAVGYETPTAIQSATIPPMMAGADLIGQAQTGTGKTAAFALPLLSRIDLSVSTPQVLVLAPTRELAIQVAEAFQRYASHMPGFHVLPIYGGQDYQVQLRGLRRGVHVVVGTPGRVMDHMRRATLNLSALRCLVLDEADEMLRMGFIDDVEWILEQTPPERQTALFSATMPPPIRTIAERYLRNPQEISIRLRTTTAATIRQRYWVVSGLQKLDALTRILETEDFEGVLIFVRTKIATVELAERLEARGYPCAAINGDMAQKQREKTIEDLKAGRLDILVATDVAARGLDVERVSHVVNFDIPNDAEVYVHRIGRTGRAGRHGDAILFVAPREQRMLRVIERATNQAIERMDLPSTEVVNDKRVARFMQQITDTLANQELGFYRDLIERYQREHDTETQDIAAALARLVQGDEPMLLKPEARPGRGQRREAWGSEARDERPRSDSYRDARPRDVERPARAPYEQQPQQPRSDFRPRPTDAAFAPGGEQSFRRQPSPAPGERPPQRYRPPVFERADHRPPRAYEPPRERQRDFDAPPGEPGFEPPARERTTAPDGYRPPRERADSRPAERARPPSPGMETFRIEVGHQHRVQPGNIVGAIANEVGIDARDIGRIQIYDEFSTVDLPQGMPKDIFHVLKKVWVSGQQLRISRADGDGPPTTPPRRGDDRTAARPAAKKDRHRDRKNKGAPKRPR